MARILLLRHGETDWNRAQRLQGWAPVGLTERGREQARAAGTAIAAEYAVDRIVTSDLERTVETVRELRRGLDVPFERDPDWRERDFGALQGLEYEAAFSGHPEFSIYESGHWAVEATPEGGESWLDLDRRIQSAFADLQGTVDNEETVLVVTHGGPIHVVLGAIAGLDASAALTEYEIGNCSLVELAVDPVGAERGAADTEATTDTTDDGEARTAIDGVTVRRGPIVLAEASSEADD